VYAVDGSCYVLASVALTGQDTFDMLCDTPEKQNLLNPETGKPGGGFSMIFGPDGRPLCELLAEDKEGLLYAQIKLPMITASKAAADLVEHHSRPHVTRLTHDRSLRRPVVNF
jgi:nitrilase